MGPAPERVKQTTKSDAIGMPLPTCCAQREFMRSGLSTAISRLPVQFTRVVTASASFTLNDHIGQPSPINANNEFGLTMTATKKHVGGGDRRQDRVD
jgi:hypothetical protein